MNDPLQEGQFGRYQPRKGYGLRLRDVRDPEGEFWAALLSAMGLIVIGHIVALFAGEIARAFIVVGLWIFGALALWLVPRLLRGK